MIKFSTQTGSLYELDAPNKRVRRLQGTHEPTPRQGEDGEFREYFSAEIISQGLLLVWNEEFECTLTSPIVSGLADVGVALLEAEDTKTEEIV